jgi:plasmid stabilization system protein ParE
MRDIIIEPLATQDLAESIAFYDGQQDGLGLEFLSDVKTMLQKIADNPRLFAAYHRDTRKASLARFPHLILYRFDDQAIQVIGVMHARRNPRRFRSRIRHTP